MKQLTIYQIKNEVTNSPYFFSRSTMKFFKQTLRDFHVNKTEEKDIYYVWANYGQGCPKGKTERYYNATTKTLHHNLEDAKKGE